MSGDKTKDVADPVLSKQSAEDGIATVVQFQGLIAQADMKGNIFGALTIAGAGLVLKDSDAALGLKENGICWMIIGLLLALTSIITFAYALFLIFSAVAPRTKSEASHSLGCACRKSHGSDGNRFSFLGIAGGCPSLILEKQDEDRALEAWTQAVALANILQQKHAKIGSARIWFIIGYVFAGLYGIFVLLMRLFGSAV